MSAAGALLGLIAGVAVLLVAGRVRAIRRPQLEMRVLPYLRDLPGAGAAASGRRRSALGALTGPPLRAAADALERLLGGGAAVQRRLDRAGSVATAHDFRVEQVVWGLVGFAAAAALCLLRQLHAGAGSAGGAVAALVVCAIAFVLGAMCRDSRLTTQVRERERRMVAEFPSLAALLALSVAAGEAPVAALDRVVARSNGPLSVELARVLAQVRTGQPVAAAFDDLAARTGLPLVARFAAGVATAVERGTPLADVLHAQAADVREAGRRELIESGARREVLMMAPVVFLVLPVVVLFALYPGLLSLHLVTS
jgi:tight adherence protein C